MVMGLARINGRQVMVYSLDFTVMSGALGDQGTWKIAELIQMAGMELLPIIGILCVIGSYALRNSFFDIVTMLFFGLLGFLMRKFKFPVVPMLLAIVLGPALEEHLRMSLIISDGDPSIFITHPISLVFIIIALVSFFVPLLRPLISNKTTKKRNMINL